MLTYLLLLCYIVKNLFLKEGFMMELAIINKPKSKQEKEHGKIYAALHNATFLYIVKRLLTSLLTLILLAMLVTALIRMLPDTTFYDVKTYELLEAKAGTTVANRWRTSMLFSVGFVDMTGRRISIIESVGTLVYWILPIYKKIPIAWSTTTYEPIKFWEGLIYLGRSSSNRNEYVLDLISERMGISFTISIVVVALTYITGIPLGVAMAKKPGGVVDKIGNIFIVLNYAIPALVFYLLMNTLFGRILVDGSPLFNYYYDKESPFLTLIPPIFCVWFLSIPGLSIWVRRFMTDELSSDYVKFARSKGLSESTIMYRHVFRNAFVPLVRNIPATLLGAFIGSYFIEYIWLIPGTGVLLVRGLQGTIPDVQLVQGLTIIYGAVSMLSFLLGDIITVFADPRIKLEA